MKQQRPYELAIERTLFRDAVLMQLAARFSDMRISVFTGPFLLADDPIRRGVRIPRSFWKVIAFIHDQTGELCATGYTMVLLYGY